jgi:hypothetical protein
VIGGPAKTKGPKATKGSLHIPLPQRQIGYVVTPIYDKCRRRNIVSFKGEGRGTTSRTRRGTPGSRHSGVSLAWARKLVMTHET